MRNEFEITADLQKARAKYHDKSSPANENALKTFQRELNDYFLKGAKWHDGVTGLVGMRKNPSTVEIGGTLNGKTIRARGASREEAVANWNSKNFVK